MGKPRRKSRSTFAGVIVATCGVLLIRSFWVGSSGEDGPGARYAGRLSRETLASLWGWSRGEEVVPVVPVVAACVRIRNEARYLREWIEFHRLVGVTYFYVFDDDSVDETRAVLAPYVASGEAFVWGMSASCRADRGAEVCADRRHDALHGERGFRDECLRTNPGGAEWIVMTDVDEFLYPSAGRSVAEHLARHCDPRVAYALARWHVFGASGHRRRPELPSIEAYRLRGREDDRGCYPHLTCGDDFAPPICAKVIARARCVARQGTHYVVESSAECVDIYAGEGKAAAVDARSAFAVAQHAACAAPLHLNHYAVRSREDYVAKFERGRISSERRDVDRGFAERTASGSVTRTLPRDVVEAFLEADEVLPRHKKAGAAATRAELMLLEFARRDHSDVLDETVLRFAAPLRRALGLDPAGPATLPLMTWACNATLATKARPPTKPPIKALFVHVPKTAGTTLNLVLAAAATRQRKRFHALTFADLERPARRAAAAAASDLLSAETDVSFLASVPTADLALFSFLRDPIARAASQIEHHLAAGRLAGPDAALRLVSPSLCPQLERDAFCAELAHPRKCRAGGWCSIFQNHQTQLLAGAQHFPRDRAAALRRTSANLLCAARRSLASLLVVGLTERLQPSLCLLFHALGYGAVFRDCCDPGKPPCAIFQLRASKHSAADRARSRPPANASSYLATYLDDDLLLAAMYEGNALDCALYADALRLLDRRLDALADRLRPFPPDDLPLMRHCDRGARLFDAAFAASDPAARRRIFYDTPPPPLA